jgi:hypothetical protein
MSGAATTRGFCLDESWRFLPRGGRTFRVASIYRSREAVPAVFVDEDTTAHEPTQLSPERAA